MKILLFTCVLFAFGVHAETPKETYCRNHADRSSIVKTMRDYHNMMGFANASGFLGLHTGVCWWHSRFHRNVSYLVQMDPSLPQPTDKEAKGLVKKIISGNEVVTLPGFANFREFTLKYQDEIQSGLNGWINRDFLLKQEWIKSVRGKTSMSVDEFQRHMEETLAQFQETDGLMFVMLQVKGPVAHAWLIANMEKVDAGWNLSIVDSQSPLYVYDIFISNDATGIAPSGKFPQNREYLNAAGYVFQDGDGVAYVYQQSELKRLKRVVEEYCAR